MRGRHCPAGPASSARRGSATRQALLFTSHAARGRHGKVILVSRRCNGHTLAGPPETRSVAHMAASHSSTGDSRLHGTDTQRARYACVTSRRGALKDLPPQCSI